ncbi:FG-GAP repeat protein, partial [Acidobacteriota bacterium]
GDTIAVGARYGYIIDPGGMTGAAYVFQRDETGVWEQKQKLTARDAMDSAHFGWSVSIDDDWVIVGANGDAEIDENAGAAYLFKHDDNTGVWEQEQKIIGREVEYWDYFGHSVDISGKYAIVGTPGDDGDGNLTTTSGAAYLFERKGKSWEEIKMLTADDAAEWKELGYCVAMDKEHVIAGSPGNSTTAEESGSAYIYPIKTVKKKPKMNK